MERRLYEAIKYTFDETEIRLLGESLARESQTVFDLREQKASVAAEFAGKIKTGEGRLGELTTKINNGYELREVECLVLLETPRPGLKRIVRIDTNEMVREEAMTMQEMQGNFGFAEGGEGT